MSLLPIIVAPIVGSTLDDAAAAVHVCQQQAMTSFLISMHSALSWLTYWLAGFGSIRFSSIFFFFFLKFRLCFSFQFEWSSCADSEPKSSSLMLVYITGALQVFFTQHAVLCGGVAAAAPFTAKQRFMTRHIAVHCYSLLNNTISKMRFSLFL